MKKLPLYYHQTKLHDTEKGIQGNCGEVCFSCILGVPKEDLPDFFANGLDPREYWELALDFVEDHGYWLLINGADHIPKMDVPYVVSGTSPRSNDVNHCVIMLNGKMIHDPHPDGTGLLDIKYIYEFIPNQDEQ